MIRKQRQKAEQIPPEDPATEQETSRDLPERNVVWFCNNLLIAGGEGGNFDREYRNDAAFERKLKEQNAHLAQRMGKIDVAPLFGCHPLITIMEEFPCFINFAHGARTPMATSTRNMATAATRPCREITRLRPGIELAVAPVNANTTMPVPEPRNAAPGRWTGRFAASARRSPTG